MSGSAQVSNAHNRACSKHPENSGDHLIQYGELVACVFLTGSRGDSLRRSAAILQREGIKILDIIIIIIIIIIDG